MDVTLTDVLVVERGSSLLADAAIGATVLVVEDTTDFGETAEDVGVIDLDGLRYGYTGVDAETGAITLDAPLTAAALTGDPVWLVAGDQVATDWIAICDGGEGEDIKASVPFELRALLPEGHYDPPIPVTITDSPTPVVVGADGRTPVIDGAMIDPSTLPDVTIPTDPPATSPAPVILPGPATAIVTWTRDTDARTRYDVYAATSDTAPLDATTLVAEGVTGPAQWVSKFVDGTLIPADVDSYFALVATNIAGDAAPSPWTAGRAGVIDPEFVTLTVDTLLANDTFTQALTAAGASIGGGTWDASKFELPEALLVDLVTHLATFYGDVVARTLTAEHLKVLGAYNIIEGILTLANGINPPAAPRLSVGPVPAVQMVYYDSSPMPAADRYGLAPLSGGGWLSARVDGWTTAVNSFTAGGMVTFAGPTLGNFYPRGGAVQLGTSYFVLGQDGARSNAWYVYKFDAAWNKTGELLYTSTSSHSITLGTDGTNLVLAVRRSDNNNLAVDRYSTSLTLVGSALAMGTWPSAALTGAVWDTARSRILVASTTEIRAFNSSTGARVTADDIPRPSGNQVRGLGWDGTRYHVLDSTGKIHALAQRTTSTAITATVTALNSAGTVETTPSPAATITLKAGQYLQLQADPLNDDGDPLKPKRVQFYVSAPTTRRAQGVLAEGTLTQVLDVVSTGGAIEPTVNGFDAYNITPGAVRSDAADLYGKLIDLKGSGDGRAGPHRWTVTEAGWIDDIDWQPAALAGTWANFGTEPTYAHAAYLRLGRVVYLRGLVKSGSGLILTLPAGYRPDVVSMFPVVTGGPNTGAASTGTAHTHAMPNTGRIDVEQDGSVRLLYGVNTYVSLAGICFPVDQ